MDVAEIPFTFSSLDGPSLFVGPFASFVELGEEDLFPPAVRMTVVVLPFDTTSASLKKTLADSGSFCLIR